MSKPKTLTVEIICLDKAEATDREPLTGWGEDASQINVTGKIRELMIKKDGDYQFAIRINDDGSIIITDHGHMCFETDVPQNLRLKPYHTWKDE